MNKFMKVGLVSLMAAATLAGCGGGGDSEKCPVKIGFVTDTGGIDDKSFNQSSYEGIKQFAKDNKIDKSCISYVESKSDADYVPNLSQMAEDGNDLVVAAGYLFDKAMGQVSKDYPDTKFFVIDTVVKGKNVVSGVFAAEESSYLAGVAAAMQTKAEGGDTVGFIGGMEGDTIGAFQAGFEQGVASVDPTLKIYVDYAGSFDDAAAGQTVAQKQYNAGAKVIYHAAGNAGNGAIKEAMERAKNGEKVWVIGVDRDQYNDGLDKDTKKSVILTSAMKRVDAATEQISKEVLDKKFKGGKTKVFNLANDGVGYPEKNPNLSDDISKKLDEVVAAIKKGDTKVSSKYIIKNGSMMTGQQVIDELAK